jgi:tRNA(adenine34) deaminase
MRTWEKEKPVSLTKEKFKNKPLARFSSLLSSFFPVILQKDFWRKIMVLFDESASQEAIDLHFMKEALREAKKAFLKKEVPVGAVLVHERAIIARGHNQVEMLHDATAHAEMLCLTAGAAFFNNWRLTGTTLYCTLEPCTMCAGAILASRVKRLVWGAQDLRVGANGSWIDIFSQKHPMHQVEVCSGVLQADSSGLLKEFFQKERKD